MVGSGGVVTKLEGRSRSGEALIPLRVIKFISVYIVVVSRGSVLKIQYLSVYYTE